MSNARKFILAVAAFVMLINTGFAMEVSAREPLLDDALCLVRKLSRPIEIDRSKTKLIDLISRLNKELDIPVILDENCINRMIVGAEDVNHIPEQQSLIGLSIFAAMQKYCSVNGMTFCIAGDFCLIVNHPKRMQQQ